MITMMENFAFTIQVDVSSSDVNLFMRADNVLQKHSCGLKYKLGELLSGLVVMRMKV